jgi:hypothetical protein
MLPVRQGWSTLRKDDLRAWVEQALRDEAKVRRVVVNMCEEDRAALGDALERGGSMLWDEFASRHGDDVDESPYWDEAIPKTVMGRLRVYGLLAEATVDGDVFVTVPVELRPIIGQLLGTGQGVPDGKQGRGDKCN